MPKQYITFFRTKCLHLNIFCYRLAIQKFTVTTVYAFAIPFRFPIHMLAIKKKYRIFVTARVIHQLATARLDIFKGNPACRQRCWPVDNNKRCVLVH